MATFASSASDNSLLSDDASPPSPEDALMILQAPDGYYKYLRVSRNSVSPSSAAASSSSAAATADDKNNTAEAQHPLLGGCESTINEDLVKKNYRKLSLKHHPDKGGDIETFRVLNRAQRVLLNPKLRQQYDIVGIDLDDDDEHHRDPENNEDPPSTTQGIVQEMAGQVLAGMIQLGVKTLMMGAVAVVLVRYRWTLYPALAFLFYIAFQLFKRSRCSVDGQWHDGIPTLSIASGLLMMHYGRRSEAPADSMLAAAATTTTWMFWCGEALVIFMFTFNSLPNLPRTPITYGSMAVGAMLAALWFRGSAWNYGTIVCFELILAVLTAMAFPVMEMVLETILNDKLRKVGDKVRAHHLMMEKYYQRAKLRD